MRVLCFVVGQICSNESVCCFFVGVGQRIKTKNKLCVSVFSDPPPQKQQTKKVVRSTGSINFHSQPVNTDLTWVACVLVFLRFFYSLTWGACF